jgi:hypothetical protein
MGDVLLYSLIVYGLMALMAVMAIVSEPIVRSDPVRGPAMLGFVALLIMTICIVGLVVYGHSVPSHPSGGPRDYEVAATFLVLLAVGFVHLILGIMFLLDAAINNHCGRRSHTDPHRPAKTSTHRAPRRVRW